MTSISSETVSCGWLARWHWQSQRYPALTYNSDHFHFAFDAREVVFASLS